MLPSFVTCILYIKYYNATSGRWSTVAETVTNSPASDVNSDGDDE